jgi:hypothetical protein
MWSLLLHHVGAPSIGEPCATCRKRGGSARLIPPLHLARMPSGRVAGPVSNACALAPPPPTRRPPFCCAAHHQVPSGAGGRGRSTWQGHGHDGTWTLPLSRHPVPCHLCLSPSPPPLPLPSLVVRRWRPVHSMDEPSEALLDACSQPSLLYNTTSSPLSHLSCSGDGMRPRHRALLQGVGVTVQCAASNKVTHIREKQSRGAVRGRQYDYHTQNCNQGNARQGGGAKKRTALP